MFCCVGVVGGLLMWVCVGKSTVVWRYQGRGLVGCCGCGVVFQLIDLVGVGVYGWGAFLCIPS